MAVSKLIKKIMLWAVFVFCMNIAAAQPPYPPIPFEDDYRGKIDMVVKSAKVKIKKTYYKFGEGNEPNIVYITREYNKKGFLTNQKWYNLLSKKEMYSAYYEYDSEDYFTSCLEKMTSEFDDFDYFSRKLKNDGYPATGTEENPLGEIIPIDKDSNTIVKTLYTRDTLGGYIAKKYFYDGSFYKEKECPSWQYGPQPNVGLYLNRDKTVDYLYSYRYEADTLYRSADTLNIRIRVKATNVDYLRILKIKHNNNFITTEVDKRLRKMRLYFSYQNSAFDDGIVRSELKSITYLNYSIAPVRFLLIHKFQSLDSFRIPLNDRIELKEMQKLDAFITNEGLVYYTNLKNGGLFNEERYHLAYSNIQRLDETYYGENNLIKEKIYFPASFELDRFSRAFDYNQKNSVAEINEYEYFD